MVTAPKKHRAVRDEDGNYDYRGCFIWKVKGISPGYWGRWVVMVRCRGRFTTLSEAKAHIDATLDKEIEHGE